jgi:hypothetical protein
MSNARFSILQARAVKDCNISDAQFRTLAALGTYADKDGWCYPLLSTLGSDLGKSKQAVGRDTIALRKLGYLEVTPRHDKNGSRRSSMYRLIFDLPRQRDVDTPSTSLIDTPSTSEVDVNAPSNAPKERIGASAPINLGLDCKLGHNADFSQHNLAKSPLGILNKIFTGEPVTEEDIEHDKGIDQSPKMFEKAFGTGTWPWSSNNVWIRFEKFVREIHRNDPQAFGKYVIWRATDGKYTGMNNKQIRTNPQVFMDTGWAEFEASQNTKGTKSDNGRSSERLDR